MKIPCITERMVSGYEVKDCSRLEIVSIPIGVTLYVSDSQKYNEDAVIEVENNSTINSRIGIDGFKMETLFLFWKGVSNDLIEFNTHAIDSNYKWLEHQKRATKTTLIDDLTNALLGQDFSPKGSTTITATAGQSKDYFKSGKNKIVYSASDIVGITFDDNTDQLKILEDELSLLNINEKVTFHNGTGSDITIVIWWC